MTKKNQGNQPRRGRGGGILNLKRCKKCGYHVVKIYFKYHECRIKADGTLDTWEPYAGSRGSRNI